MILAYEAGDVFHGMEEQLMAWLGAAGVRKLLKELGVLMHLLRAFKAGSERLRKGVWASS
jgi:hypothetical protein